MPRISTFMYSDNARMDLNGDQQQINITNPMIAFKPAFIPSTFSFAVTIGIAGFDLRQAHKLQYIFKELNSDDNIIDTGDVLFPARSNNVQDTDSLLPLEHRGVVINLDFRNVIFKREGDYISYVYFDGELLGSFPIYVKGIETNG